MATSPGRVLAAEGEDGSEEVPSETVVVALRNDEVSAQALRWALVEYGNRYDGRPVIFMLLHIVSDVPNAQMKSVRVSEAELERVAIHLRDRVLPFLESMQDLCDLHEVMSSIEVVKDDLRPEAIIDSAIRLQANTLVLGGSENTTTWGTIAHCTALGKTPPSCRVIVVTNGKKTKEVSPEGELVPIEEDTTSSVDLQEDSNGELKEMHGIQPSVSTHSQRGDPPRPANARSTSALAGIMRGKKGLNGKVLVKQRSEERVNREEEGMDGVYSSQETSPVRFAASLLSQLSISRAPKSYSSGGKSPDRMSSPPSRSPFGSGRRTVLPPTLPDIPQRGEPKGRIIVFSMAGCERSMAVKALLRSKGAAYSDVSLDAFPERRREMESRSHKTTAPQIFFNAEHIGDCESLQALEQQGELDAMIEDVYDREAPGNAPHPPTAELPPEDDDPHANLVRRMRQSISVQDRLHTFHVYHRCFVGSDAVEWLCKVQGLHKLDALALGNKLLTKHFFHHVTRERRLEDSYQFYKFVDDLVSASNRDCLNFYGSIWSREMRPPALVVDELQRIMRAICDEYVAEDGRWVDYAALSKSELLQRYRLRSQELQRLQVEGLSREEKLTMFLNAYNMMALEVVASGAPFSSQIERTKLFSKYTYLIGGSHYSLMDIENGVLRGNKKPINSMTKPFTPRDPRLRIATMELEPLIHFALFNGRRSGPPLRVYSADQIMPQLRAAARAYFEDGGIRMDLNNRQIALSKIISWYEKDFGKSGYDVLIWIAQLMDEPRRSHLLSLAREINSINVIYVEYDWANNDLQWR